MNSFSAYVGLDVHKSSISVAIADAGVRAKSAAGARSLIPSRLSMVW